MKKAIILDVDGTLWDSTSRIAEAYNETMIGLGMENSKISEATIRGFMGFVTEDIAKIVFPDLPFETQMSYIKQCMDYECTYLKEHPGKLYEDVEEVLFMLSKKYDLFIVSNCQDGYIETLFASYPISQFIKDYECSGRTGMKKGDNIRLLMERNNVKNAVYVGDTEKDREASVDAGISFIYASYGFGKVKDYDTKIDTFKELLDRV